ncbi:hypothetical protein [Shinella sp.]|uniref:hypothetical protein n=1 Tax=Shinella sp. TaxID=1870904 RepID=UPI003F706B99
MDDMRSPADAPNGTVVLVLWLEWALDFADDDAFHHVKKRRLDLGTFSRETGVWMARDNVTGDFEVVEEVSGWWPLPAVDSDEVLGRKSVQKAPPPAPVVRPPLELAELSTVPGEYGGHVANWLKANDKTATVYLDGEPVTGFVRASVPGGWVDMPDDVRVSGAVQIKID